jgi:hypothetical protein
MLKGARIFVVKFYPQDGQDARRRHRNGSQGEAIDGGCSSLISEDGKSPPTPIAQIDLI